MSKSITQGNSQLPSYQPPRIVHKGKLKQFTGSPLGSDPSANPDDVLGLPGG